MMIIYIICWDGIIIPYHHRTSQTNIIIIIPTDNSLVFYNLEAEIVVISLYSMNQRLARVKSITYITHHTHPRERGEY